MKKIFCVCLLVLVSLTLCEEEEDFNETLDLVNECKFDNAFSFIYSPCATLLFLVFVNM